MFPKSKRGALPQNLLSYRLTWAFDTCECVSVLPLAQASNICTSRHHRAENPQSLLANQNVL